MDKMDNDTSNNSNESIRSHDPVPLTRAIFLALICKTPSITGYELMNLVPKVMKNRIRFKSGTLYSELRRLENMGLVSSEQSSTGRKQRKYKISPLVQVFKPSLVGENDLDQIHTSFI